MSYTATGYSYVRNCMVHEVFSDPVDAICCAIEIMGEGDVNAGVFDSNNEFYNKDKWDILWLPAARAASF